jgi:hypothetical protein
MLSRVSFLKCWDAWTNKNPKNKKTFSKKFKKKISDGQRQRQCFPYECIITRAGCQTNKTSQEANDCATIAPGWLNFYLLLKQIKIDKSLFFLLTSLSSAGTLCGFKKKKALFTGDVAQL